MYYQTLSQPSANYESNFDLSFHNQCGPRDVRTSTVEFFLSSKVIAMLALHGNNLHMLLSQMAGIGVVKIIHWECEVPVTAG